MVSTVNKGTINMPKILRHLSHRTSNIREVVFQRDAIYDKDFAKFKKDDDSETELSGPPVNFGYESSSTTPASFDKVQDSGTITHRYINTPELTIGGLKVLQTPVISRSGKLERTGARISGECSFYVPSLATVKALPEFSETSQFDEFESYDKFIDIEREVYKPSDITYTGSDDITINISSTSRNLDNITLEDLSAGSTYNPGYEVDRIRFKIKTADTDLTTFTLNGKEGGADKALTWTITDAFTPTDWVLIDLPIRDITAGETKEIQVNGIGKTFTANPVTLNVDKLSGDSNNYLSSLIIAKSSSNLIELKDINIYKSAEWSLETIKDYRDEYMIIQAVRTRGDRTSRRRTYG
jgi:hypothetical protein